MNTQEYRTNRAKFSLEELRKHQGKWVAFSSDGSRILARADNLLDLDQRLADAGENPENVGLEYIQLEDVFLGGGELG